MANFKFQRLTPTLPELMNVVTCVLGQKGEIFTDSDRNKAMKMANDGAGYVMCGDGDEIEAFVDNILPAPLNSEWGSNGEQIKRIGGGVRRNPMHREQVTVATGASVALLDYVVAAPQLAVGVKGLAQVKKGEPKVHMWRVISFITGNGEAGSTVLIERNN